MTKIQYDVLVIPLLVKVFSWIVLLIVLGGLVFLGDRTPSDTLFSGLTVVFTGVIILLLSNKKCDQRVILFLGVLGFLSLSYMVFKDIYFYSDFIGAVFKSFIFVLFYSAVLHSIRCIKSQSKS